MPKFKRADIVTLISLYGSKLVVILTVDPSKPKNAYTYRQINAKTVYRGSDDQMDRKVGTVADDHPYFVAAEQKEADEPTYDQAIRYLQTLKEGDIIKIRRRGGVDPLTFKRILPNGRKFVFLATNMRGTSYKYPYQGIVMPTTDDLVAR